MKHHRHKLPLVALILLALIAVCCIYEAHSRRLRDATYETALQSYSAALRPGVTRKDVESYIRSRGMAFGRGRGNIGRETVDDLVPVGKDENTWVCSDNVVYVQFHFEPEEGTSDADRLMNIDLFHRPGRCL